jgi:hypothetical protein
MDKYDLRTSIIHGHVNCTKYIYENIDEVPDNEKIELINYAVSRGRID